MQFSNVYTVYFSTHKIVVYNQAFYCCLQPSILLLFTAKGIGSYSIYSIRKLIRKKYLFNKH